jgi:hypothetical protein
MLSLLFVLPGLSAQAQSSSCVRDASGALQCASQRTPLPRGGAPLRVVPRNNLTADALRRSNAIAEQRRDAIEQQRRETDARDARQRPQCLDRSGKTASEGCS